MQIKIASCTFGTISKGSDQSSKSFEIGLEQLRIQGQIDIIKTTVLLSPRIHEKRLGDLRRLTASQTLVTHHKLTLV